MSSSAPSSREIVWGLTVDPGDIYEPSDGLKRSGYTGTPAPVYEIFNWLLNRIYSWVAYLRSRGVPDYDATETYNTGDFVQYTDGRLYQRIGVSSSQGTAPTNAGYWVAKDVEVTNVASSITVTGTDWTLNSATLVKMGSVSKLILNVTGQEPNVSGSITVAAGLYSLLPESSLLFGIQSSMGNDTAYVNFVTIPHGWSVNVGAVGTGANWTLDIEATKV